MDINFAESEEHVLSFDYASLELVQQQHIQQKTVEIKERLRRSAQDIWEIGQRLVAVRSHLKHGQFDIWLKAKFGWSRRTAYNFISIYETFDKSATVAQMNATTSALYLMAAPSTSATVRNELLEREQQGERITREMVREAVRKERSIQARKHQKQGSAVPPEAESLPATTRRSAPEIIAVIPRAAQVSHHVPGWNQLGLQHRLFCGDTAQAEFINQIPYAALTLGITSDDWDHDWIIERADNVIILRESAVAQNFVEQVI